jgi:glutamate synthase domain-containing protein 2/ferredoxin
MLEALKSSSVVNLNKDSRYHISIHPAPPRMEVPLRLLLVRNDACFNCGICVDACIYGVHHRQDDMRMTLGAIDQFENACRTCLRCVRECPKEALSVPPNPEFVHSSFGQWTAPVLTSLLKQAETGKVPVSGAGYNGKFAGPGFDGIWTDMSEIVRPTRDGIHGREYISTAIILGSRPTSGRDTARPYSVIELPVPFLLDLAPFPAFHPTVETAIVNATRDLKTLLFVTPTSRGADEPFAVPVLKPSEIGMLNNSKHYWMIELQDGEGFNSAFHELRKSINGTVLSVRIPFDPDRALDLALQGAHVLHLMADASGNTPIGHVSQALRIVHLKLVEAGIRDRVTLLAGGYVAAAEHLPKSILCGADGVSLDLTIPAALQMWKGGDPEERLDRFGIVDSEWGSKRIRNLMAAWRDQLLEILGAMGLREVRRLRGEVGRGLFYEELLREFKSVFGTPLETPSKPEIPVDLIPQISQTIAPVQRNFHNELSKFRVNVTDACIHCAVCVDTCPFGVFAMPNGFNHLLPAKSSQCIGTACESKDFYCVPKCPTDAIRVDLDPTYQGMGDPRWTGDLLISTFKQAETGVMPEASFESEVGASDGGFDRMKLSTAGILPAEDRIALQGQRDAGGTYRTAIPLNRRKDGAQIWIPVPWYGGGMSYGSISLNVMLARAKAAKAFGTFMSTGEGGYPDALIPYADHVITQVATGLFGVREDTISRTRIVEFKYAQGAKPGLGGHLLADKVTAEVAKMRGSMQWSSLFSPFPFHSVYSVEDHKKHLDWIRVVNPNALISVKVSTPSDVDMVAVGSYYAGANILQLDGSYGGTGAAPDIAKKNIATPIEFAIPKVHKFLMNEGIRDDLVILASGGVRTPLDILKSILLGADGVVVGTAELVAIECDRCTNCERGRGCPFGIATSDPDLTPLIDPDWAAQRIVNLYHSWRSRLIEYLDMLGVETLIELRGRTDLLEYVE